jgi:glycosyltransferase involved in cell wall biosynthesis
MPMTPLDLADGTPAHHAARNPRVVHIVPELFGHEGRGVGGAERYAYELARHMAREVSTRLVSFGDSPGRFRDGELDVLVLGNSRYVRGLRQNPIARGLIRQVLSSEVVHCHQQRTVATTTAACLSRATGRRIFVTDHGGGGWDISSYIATDRLFHGLLHVSPYSAEISHQSHLTRARVLWGGVDESRFRPDMSAERTGRVLFVGRLAPNKGVNYLISGLPEGVGLDVVGPPVDERYVRDLHQLAVGRDVRFLGAVGEDQLTAAYQTASCLVLPSVYRPVYGGHTYVPELLGQTLLESMSCGTPVICTDVAAMPQVVQHGVTGLVVPPNDPAALGAAVGRVVRDRRLAADLGNAGRAHVLDRFTWSGVARRCLAFYTELGRRPIRLPARSGREPEPRGHPIGGGF